MAPLAPMPLVLTPLVPLAPVPLVLTPLVPLAPVPLVPTPLALAPLAPVPLVLTPLALVPLAPVPEAPEVVSEPLDGAPLDTAPLALPLAVSPLAPAPPPELTAPPQAETVRGAKAPTNTRQNPERSIPRARARFAPSRNHANVFGLSSDTMIGLEGGGTVWRSTPVPGRARTA